MVRSSAAARTRRGCFELADRGTLFLDEIGEMPRPLQVSLLRVLEEREVRRVGGEEAISVDVRIVAATQRDLSADMRTGRLRSDLYFRLSVVTLTVPPLRNRLEDLPEEIRRAGSSPRVAPLSSQTASPPAAARDPWNGRTLREVRSLAAAEAEERYLRRLLERTGGRIAETARLAGVHPRYLFTKMRKYGLRKEDFRKRLAAGAGGVGRSARPS
jgi:DNA-binding NtrC family response regulator